MHVRTNLRKLRGDRKFSEAVAATGIPKGSLSRIERGEQFPRRGQVFDLAMFYDPETLRALGEARREFHPIALLARLYPASVLRCIQLERNCVDCGRALPPDARANRKRHVPGGCS